jgi:hypothetical protein
VYLIGATTGRAGVSGTAIMAAIPRPQRAISIPMANRRMQPSVRVPDFIYIEYRYVAFRLKNLGVLFESIPGAVRAATEIKLLHAIFFHAPI